MKRPSRRRHWNSFIYGLARFPSATTNHSKCSFLVHIRLPSFLLSSFPPASSIRHSHKRLPRNRHTPDRRGEENLLGSHGRPYAGRINGPECVCLWLRHVCVQSGRGRVGLSDCLSVCATLSRDGEKSVSGVLPQGDDRGRGEFAALKATKILNRNAAQRKRRKEGVIYAATRLWLSTRGASTPWLHVGCRCHDA